MKFAVMQPYFMPYIGYFQLMHAVDVFVVYDAIEFSKKGWIHRNRILVNGEPQYFTVNLEKASDYMMVNERFVSTVFMKERRKILAKIETNYRKAEYFEETMPLVVDCLEFDNRNLFDFIYYSIVRMAEHIGIQTELKVSSSLPIDQSLKNKYKLWKISECLGIQDYINPLGGESLYDKSEFASNNVHLSFLESCLSAYPQHGAGQFVSALSIIDVLFNLGRAGTLSMLTDYQLH